MLDFFASLYEWFGINPLYSIDMGDYLRGWDITWYRLHRHTLVCNLRLDYDLVYSSFIRSTVSHH